VQKGWKLAKAEPQLCLDCHEQPGPTPRHSVTDSVGCTACHDPHSSEHPSQLTAWPAGALCALCHDPQSGKSIHAPVAKGECLGCHDPHIGQAAPLLKAEGAKLCAGCHKPEQLAKERFKHAPVVENRCGDCHVAHVSEHPKLTRASGKAQCLACHGTKSPAGAATPGPAMRIDLERPTVHAAVESGDCQDCHAPGHSAPAPALLQKAAVELCLPCHDAPPPRFAHGALRAGDCTGCHEPHSTKEATLLRDTGATLCVRCHEDDVTGRASVHAPVAQGKCADCHEAHGAANPFGLKAEPPCAACHPKVGDAPRKHLVLQRHGCAACHDPHGSDQRTLLLKNVNALCASCHPGQKDGMHVTTMVRGGHKVAGGPDPRVLEKDFSCASCHDPHGSTSPKLLRHGDSSMESCDLCHGDRSGKHPELKDIHRARRPRKPTEAAAPKKETTR
jgi:predicted CXXCH cytochrome family protein